MKVKDLVRLVDDSLPFAWAEDWDNVGLLLGDPEDSVEGVTVALDPSLDAMRDARESGCSVLVSHHPLIFSPLRRIDCSEGTGLDIAYAVRNRISVVCLHTNWDSAGRGVNRILADGIGLQNVTPIVPSARGGWGEGAVGMLREPLPAVEAARGMGRSWNLSRIGMYGSPERPISRIALCGGSGGSLWYRALDAGADVFVTADMKYHEKMEALRSGLALFDADHGEMEACTLPGLASVLSEISGLDVRLSPVEPARPLVLLEKREIP